MWRRLVILHAFQVADDVLGMFLLFIDNTLQVVVLLIHLRHYLLFQTDLARYTPLHASALLLVLATGVEYLIELGYLLLRCHFERFDLVGLIGKGAVETENHVARGAEGLILLVLAKGYARRLLACQAAPASSFHLKSLQ